MGDFIIVPIRQQDGSSVNLTLRRTTHNMLLADFIRRHEPFTHTDPNKSQEAGDAS